RSAVYRGGLHQSAIRGVLPGRKLRTRCPPRLHGFLVGAFMAANPLDEIENEAFDGISHRPASRLSPRLALAEPVAQGGWGDHIEHVPRAVLALLDGDLRQRFAEAVGRKLGK